MFKWIKSFFSRKTPPSPDAQVASVPARPTREELIRDMLRNRESAREALGAERLEMITKLIQQKEAEQEVSPAAQARKILAKMEQDKVAIFMRDLKDNPPTTH
ncbi:MAG: hypothetical protein WC043_10540 [Pseudobdellovibrionaceae bacterium]